MAATVDALLPLSLLEAVRNVDTPQGDFEAEYVPELRNKRLGLSDTVYAQIRRFTEAVKRRQRTAFDEAAGLARLIGRRPDAEAVFRAAGRYLAREAYLTVSAPRRQAMHMLPAFVVRPMALRTAQRLVRRHMGGELARVGGSLLLQVERPVTAEAAPRGAGCSYYEAALRELLRLLVGSAGVVEHVRCDSRGEGRCEWRAEWKR